jgi:hypothetical protein
MITIRPKDAAADRAPADASLSLCFNAAVGTANFLWEGKHYFHKYSIRRIWLNGGERNLFLTAELYVGPTELMRLLLGLCLY